MVIHTDDNLQPMNPTLLNSLSFKKLLGCIGALWLVSSAWGVQIYVDATGGSGGNTYNHANNSLTDYFVRSSTAFLTDNLWGNRTGGSAVTGFNSDTFELYSGETGAVLRTEISGLLPNRIYTGLRVYMLGNTTSGNNWSLDVSLDGINWITYSDYDAVGFTGTLVDTGNNGVGNVLTPPLTGTRRFWHALPNATTNASGVLRFYIRKGSDATNRSVYDGVGYENSISYNPYSNDVFISEFLADNPGPVILPGSVLDMDTDSSDWIELHNSGSTIADLSGWKLSDDPLIPDKWTFPAGVLMQPNTRLLVFASGKNRRMAGVELHTNFKLSNTGSLRLTRPDPSGTDVVLTQIAYTGQNHRASYGSTTVPPVAPAWGFYSLPTAGTANASTTVPSFVSNPTTNIDRGLFFSPISVTMSCATPGATLLYTLNGSVPAAGGAATTTVAPANAAALPTATITVSSTTILRIRAVKDGLGSSKVDTHTYLFPAHVLNQTAPPANFPPAANWSHYGTYDWAMDQNIVNHADPASRCTSNDLLAIPSVSLVMDWSELFGTSGIYPAISPVPQEGLSKAASLEMFNSDGSVTTPNAGETFSVDGRAHIFGGTSQQRWKVDKLSFNFNLAGSVSSGIYGDTATGQYSRFILDGRMGNTWLHNTDDVQRTRGDYIRDEVAAETQRLLGYAATHSRRIHLYLNGMYWGLYTLHEKPSADFQAAYQGGSADDWDVLKHSPLRSDCLDSGTFVDPSISATVRTNNTAYTNYQALLATVATGVDLTNSVNYEAVGRMLDVDAFIDYILMNFYLGNYDWAHQNWYGSYRRNHPDGRWRFHSWDAEHVLRVATDEINVNGTTITNSNQASCPTFIHQRLATNAEYRMRFADRTHKHMFNRGLFTTEKLTEICNRQFAEIDAAMRCESARWGDNRAPARSAPNTGVTYTRGVEWLAEKARMLDVVVPARNPLIVDALKSKTNALYPRVDPSNTASNIFHAPVYSQHGGRVPTGYQLSMSNPNATIGTIHYTLDGSDPRLTGGSLSPKALTYSSPVPLTGSTLVRSRIFHGGVWSALNEATFSVGTVAAAPGNLIVSKIMWKPAAPDAGNIEAGFTDDGEFEFLELFNPSSNPVDLTGISITQGLDIAPIDTAPQELAPGERAVLVAKPSAFLHRYGNLPRVIGKFINGSNLSGSERITLVNSTGTVISSFVYNQTATNPWPKNETSGTGAALVLIRPETNPNPSLGVNWRASLTNHSAPAVDDRPNLSQWQESHFGQAVDLNADTDRDGIPNLLEFALGLNPQAIDDVNQIPQMQSAPVNVDGLPQMHTTLSYRRKRFLENLDWAVETSDSLFGWTPNPPDLSVLSVVTHDDGTETVTYRLAMPLSTMPKRFFRLRVKSP